jgi:hypothetical protein
MPDYIKVRQTDGTDVLFEREPIASGGEKVVFFTKDRQHIVAFFFGELADRLERKRRLERILGQFNPTLSGAQSAYWQRHFCWPVGIVDGDCGMSPDFLRRHAIRSPALGLVAPVYRPNFFFRDRTGNLREKKGKWFTSAKVRKLLPDEERGNFLRYLQCGSIMASAVRRLHYAGLAHADLSHNNVLIDPKGGDACVIDIDSLVVPGLAPPTVLGTPGYIAPEVVSGKKLPSIETDMHALAVLLYETLLLRHPLQGPKVRSTRSAEEDELLSMGREALFVEHPTDRTNWIRPTPKVPLSRLGPYLEPLFLKTFVEALHAPARRASASEWEKALSKTFDLIHPSPGGHEWFVLSPGMPMACPSTGGRLTAPVPCAEFYREKSPGERAFKAEGHSLTIWHNMYIYKWHLFSGVSALDADRTPQGYFSFHQGRWWLVNQSGADMCIIDGEYVPHGEAVEVRPGLRLLLSEEPGARLAAFDFMRP